MTDVLITIDTELSAGRHAEGLPIADNYLLSITGATAAGGFGIDWQMDRLDERGLRAVYFVDPMPALVCGREIVERMVSPILRRGHEVQLHIHTEWLRWAKDSPVDGVTGRNIGDFSLRDQVRLIEWAAGALVAAGAPRPIAFRAGNFGANDDTLRALAGVGIAWDSSYNASYVGSGCAVSASTDLIEPTLLYGVHEVPVAGLWDRPGHFRPAQICAISAWEMREALRHAGETDAHSFALVTHSFEMLSRDRRRPNRTVMRRFTAMCDDVANSKSLRSAGFRALSPPADSSKASSRLAPSRFRTMVRMAEQAMATWRYERRLRPA